MENDTDISNLTNPNTTEAVLDCPQFSNVTAAAIDTFAYWVEGVLLCAIAVPGIAGNALSSYILVTTSFRYFFQFTFPFPVFLLSESCLSFPLTTNWLSQLGLANRSGSTTNYYLPSTPKDRSTMRAETIFRYLRAWLGSGDGAA